MSNGILISSSNFNGQVGDITFYPDTGGTVSVGSQILPYTFYTDYYYGSYQIYFSGSDKTCYALMDNPYTNFILQENYSLLEQEDGSGILTEGTFSIELTGEYSPGSINILYRATSDLPLSSDVEISFVDTLSTLTGTPLVISGTVSIVSGSTTGTSYYSIPGDYQELTKVADFSDVTYTSSGASVTLLIQTNSEFDVTPTPTSSVTPTVTPTTTTTPTITPSSTPIPIVEDGLILDWDVQNTNSYSGAGVTLTDIVGNSDGTLNGTIDYTAGNPSLGIPNYLLVEGSTTEYIVTNNSLNPYLNPANTGTDISYFLWVYPTGNGIIINEQGTTTPATSWHDSQIEIVSGQLKFRLWQLSAPYITSSTSLTLNTWNYVGLTYSGTTLVAYLNGENVGSVTGFSRMTPYNNGGGVGLYYSLGATDTITDMGDGNGATFRFGAFHLYNKGLTSSEVLENYNNTKINYFPPVSPTPTTTPTVTPTPTNTPTNTVSPTVTPTNTTTPTPSVTPTNTVSPTPSSTPSPTIESFTSVGTTSWTAPAGVTSVEYLVVGGGGGGGNGYDSGGGGGAGGGMVLTGNLSVTPGNSYTVTVGGGGTGGADTRTNNNGTNGSNSVFSSVTALGGGYGGGSRTNNPGPAGVGAGLGGAAQSTNVSSGVGGNGGGGGSAGGGGGGAGGNGTNRISSSSAGVGGAGVSSSISGSLVTYGGGGNGGTANAGTINGANGTANTGKGGGAGSSNGSDSSSGGNGGSGIVVLKYFV